MFEQASLDTRGTLKSPWGFTVSVAGQTLLVSAGMLLSLIHTDALPRGLFPVTVVGPGKPAAPAESSRPTVARSATAARHPFTAPAYPSRTAIPSAQIDLLDLDTAPIGPDIGVPGGMGLGPGLGATMLGVSARHPVAPPLTEPVAQRKAAAPASNKPIPVSSGVQAARLIRQVTSAYPALARQARISGTVRLAAIIGRDGSIQNLQVSSGHPLLTPAAVEAVKQWLYQPTLLNGEPVEVITQIDVNFTLSQ